MARYLVLFAVFLAFSSKGQVLDDSTKQIYGNKTVEYFYEDDVLRNIQRSFHPDTTLKNYDYTSPIRKGGWLYQDLGNVGTASRPFLPTKSYETGQGMGMESNLLYAPKISLFKYYNTRSPYTYLAYQMGGGHTQFEVTHSQNINARLNLTLNILKFNSEKQYGFQRSEEVLVNHWKYDVSTNYLSKNKKYRLLATFYHFNHLHNEQGGIQDGISITSKELVTKYSQNYDAALPVGIYNSERWNNLHIYQQYLAKNALQLFHILDYNRQNYGFEDPAFGREASSIVYRINPQAEVDTLSFHYRFQSLTNKVGFKGVYKGSNYQAYGKARFYTLQNKFFENYSKSITPELFIGGLAGYIFPDSTNTLDLQAELGYNSYFFNGRLFYKEFEIGFYNASLLPGLFYQRFNNGVVQFNETSKLSNINSTLLSGKLPLRFKRFALVPEIQISNIKNYVYLADVNKVAQESKHLQLYTLGLNTNYSTKHLDLSYNIAFHQTSNKKVYPIPTLTHHFNFEYNFLYAKVLRVYTGLDFFLQSRYQAHYYSPLVNHFIAVQGVKSAGQPILDFYLKFPLSKGRLALNYQFANNLAWLPILGSKGIITTPGYVGQPSSLVLKLDWPLFD